MNVPSSSVENESEERVISEFEGQHSSSHPLSEIKSSMTKDLNFSSKIQDVESLPEKTNQDVKRNDIRFYRHQVAGHYPIFWKSGVICKPIQKNEHEFYLEVQKYAPQLVRFVPKYLGVVVMEYEELPQTPKGKSTPTKVSTEEKVKHGKKRENSDAYPFSQWGPHCHQKKRKAMQDRPTMRYIRLEDLTLPFSRPNILDIKIGTRVYGIGDDPQKIKRKIAKSASTTSHSLGLRLCGMQVFSSQQNTYTFRNKFYGRNLNESGLEEAIEEFFTHDGALRSRIVKHFLKQILELLDVVSKQKTFQFFSSSLLFICEGCQPTDQKRLHGGVKNGDFQRIDLRFIDFAQAARDIEKKGVDKGFLQGLQNIVSILRKLSEQERKRKRSVNNNVSKVE
mmetsp:Transcript_1973/g.2802  ORF Transcript_1973/g.2802 Transcript_1973/m.2802 type:complete len:394 (+) Transcript_1973:136-1317(+)